MRFWVRRRIVGWPVLLLVLALASVGLGVTGIAGITGVTGSLGPSRAAATGSPCATGSVYALGGTGSIYRLDTAAGTRTVLGSLPSGPTYNGLGISADGDTVFATVSGASPSQVLELDPATGTSSAFDGPAVAGSYSFVAGAVDPSSGIYYVGTITAAGVDIYGFDPASGTPISGRIAQVALPGGSGGDMVFDATGHLYIVTSSKLVRVDQQLPADGADAQLTSTPLADVATASLNGSSSTATATSTSRAPGS